MIDTPKISVVMATYNGSKYLQDQLCSIVNQTLLPYELVVSDDKSSDNTIEIIEKFRETSPFPVIIHLNAINLGFENNFINAANLASGDFISFCDQDDVWESNKLERGVSAFSDPEVSISCHSASIIDNHGTITGRWRNHYKRFFDIAPLTMRPWFTFAGFSIIIRAEIWKKLPVERRGPSFFNINRPLPHDGWASVIGSAFGKIRFFPEDLARYRLHDNNTIGVRSFSRISKFSEALGETAHSRLNRSFIARHWARLFMEYSRSDPPEQQRKYAEDAAQFWKKVSFFELMRIKMYAEPNIFKRMVILVYLIRVGCYNTRRGGVGLGLLMKDVIVGFLQVRKSKF